MLNPVFPDTKYFACQDLYLRSMGAPSGNKIFNACHEVAQMLIEKNVSYGDSALNPIRLFSGADSQEQLKVRIDDKLNRLMKGTDYPGDNDIDDLIGYLVLFKIARQS